MNHTQNTHRSISHDVHTVQVKCIWSASLYLSLTGEDPGRYIVYNRGHQGCIRACEGNQEWHSGVSMDITDHPCPPVFCKITRYFYILYISIQCYLALPGNYSECSFKHWTTRGPKGHISCTWVQCVTFLTERPGPPFFVYRSTWRTQTCHRTSRSCFLSSFVEFHSKEK